MRQKIRTTCTRDCPDTCGVIATVEDGQIVAHRGDPEHPITRGVLCARGNHYLERFYHAERLLHPQRRTAHGWQRLSWDEALDLAAARLTRCRAELGPRSVLVVNYSGIHTWIPRLVGRLFWASFGGATTVAGGLSVEAAHAAQQLDFGGDCTHEPEDLANAAAIVVWGKNLAVTRQHWLPFVKQARRRGAPLVVIDPLRSATAKLADRWLSIRPGSDGVLALGVAQLLLERGAIDEGFVRDHTSGFDAFRELARACRLPDVVAATGLPAAQIEALARLYAERKPLATLVGLGSCYWSRGGQAVRLIDALGALSGNLGVPGGGVGTDLARSPGFDLHAKGAPRGERRSVLLPRLGEEIERAADPPLRMGWVAGANPASTAPDTNRVRRGLRCLEHLVVVEQFMTATAELADLVLPCTTYLEADDLVTSYGHPWVSLTRQVVPPLGEAKPDVEIYQLLAERLGFGAALAGSPEEWMRRLLGPVAAEGLTLERLQQGPLRHPRAVAVPYADRRFATPSGRFELVNTAPVAPVPLCGGELHLVATKTLRMVNSQILPADLPAEPVARVHPSTLAARGLREGQLAWVVGRAGRVQARLAVDESLRPDLLLLNPALWRGDSSGVNQLRDAALTDLGDGAAMHETRVELRADPPLDL